MTLGINWVSSNAGYLPCCERERYLELRSQAAQLLEFLTQKNIYLMCRALAEFGDFYTYSSGRFVRTKF